MHDPYRPKIDYRKKTPTPPPDPEHIAQYIDPYPPPRRPNDMPLIYDRDDSNDYDGEYIDPYDLDAPRRAGSQLTPKQYLMGVVGVALVILAIIALANIA